MSVDDERWYHIGVDDLRWRTSPHIGVMISLVPSSHIGKHAANFASHRRFSNPDDGSFNDGNMEPFVRIPAWA